MKKKLIYFLAFLFCFAKLTTVETSAQQLMHGNFSLGAAAPLNEFRTNTTTAGFGANLNFYVPFRKDIPLYFGCGFGYYLFGSNSQDLHEDVKVTAGTKVISTIPIDLNVTTNNNLADGFVCLRFEAPIKVIQPYIELKGGFNYLYTRTKVLDNTKGKLFTQGKDDNEINSQTVSSGFTFAYGVEGGLIIKPWDEIGINFSAAYLYGGKTEYFDKSQTAQWTVSFSGQSGSFDPNHIDPKTLNLNSDASTPRKSVTDMLIISLGVTFYIPEGVNTAKTKK